MKIQQPDRKKSRRTTEQICVVTTNSDYQQYCQNSLRRLASPQSIKLVSLAHMSQKKPPHQKATLLVSRLADMTKMALKDASVDAKTRQLVFLDDLPVEAVAKRLLPLNIRNPDRIHIAAHRDRDLTEDLIFRIFQGMTAAGGIHPIVDAWIENHFLVVLSPTFSRLEIPIEKLSRFVGHEEKLIPNFELDEDGRFLYWPHADAHLGWNQLEQIIDPAKAVTAAKKTLQYNRRYGAAIRALRESMGLKQSDIQGITERQLRRVEHGEQAATKATLEALAKAHSLSLDDYIGQLAKRVAIIC